MKNYRVTIQNIVDHNQFLKLLSNEIVFSYFYVFSSVLWFFPFLGVFVSPLCKIGFIWGAFLIIYQLLIRHQIQKSSYWYILFCFLFFYCISILCNFSGNLYNGIKHLIYTAIAFWLIATSFYEKSTVTIKKYLYRFNLIFVIIAFAASVISLLMYCFSISIEIDYFGNPIRQGLIDQRMFGVYTSANTGATTALFSVIFTFLNSFIKTGKAFKWHIFYWVNFVVQIVYFSLTLSRGGQVTTFFALAIGLTIILFPKLLKKNKVAKAFLKLLVIWVVFTGSSMLLMRGISENANIIPEKIEKIKEKKEGNDEKIYDTEIRRIESGDDMSNGRFAIWTGGLKIWSNSPIFGVVDAGYDSKTNISGQWEVENLTSDEAWWLNRAEGNLHNQYIQILVNAGSVGIVIFLLYAVLICVKYLRYLLDSKEVETTMYSIIGMTFVVISSSAVNGLFETRLVFDRQNPFGLIFWLYLGVGCALIDNFNKKDRFQQKRIAFVCDTPLQVLNAINVKLNNYKNYKADLFIYNQFSNAQNIVKRIKEDTIFENTFLVKRYACYSGVVQKFVTFFRLMFPSRVLKKHVEGKVAHDKYEYMALCFITPFTLSVFGYTQPDAVIQLEDGIGTYIGDILQDYSSKVFKSLANITYYNKILKPTQVYVYNPEIYQAKSNVPVIKIEMQKDETAQRRIEKIFGYHRNNLYSNYRMIYLTQAWEREGFSSQNEKKVLNYLRNRGLIRIHPRQENDLFAGYNIDEFNNMWEIECLHSMTSKHILIGAFSTAQIMPKIVADKEPILIFLYKIYFPDWKKDPFWENISVLIRKIKGFYRDPSKIMEPENIDELQEIVMHVEKKNEED